jgi:hypothetical protein
MRLKEREDKKKRINKKRNDKQNYPQINLEIEKTELKKIIKNTLKHLTTLACVCKYKH